MVWVRFLRDYEKHKNGQIIDVGRFNHACALVRSNIATWATVDSSGSPIVTQTDLGDITGEITYGITRGNSTLDVAPTMNEIQTWQNPFDSNAQTYATARLAQGAGCNCFVGLSDETLEQWELVNPDPETWKKVGETKPSAAGAVPAMYHIDRDENGLARNTAPTIAEITAWQNQYDSNNTTYSGASLSVGDQCVVTHFDNAVETWYCTSTSPETWVQTSLCYDLHMLNTKHLRNDPKALDDFPWDDVSSYLFVRAGIREPSNIDNNEIDAFHHNLRFGWMSWYNIHGMDINFRQEDIGPRAQDVYDEIGATTIGHYAEFLDSTVPANPPNATPHITAYRQMDNAANKLYYEYTDTNILNWSLFELNDTDASANAQMRAHQDVNGGGISEAKIQIAGQPLGTDPLNIILQTEKIYATTATAGHVLTLQPTTKSGDLTGHAEWNAIDISSDTSPTLGGNLDAGGFDLDNIGVLFLNEQAAAESSVAGKGQIWVKTATPNELYFTDDAGTDFQLGVGGGGGGGGGNAFKGALVRTTANRSVLNNTKVAFDAEIYDTDGWHDNVTNNTRLTVPAGVSRVRVKANLVFDTTGTWSGTAIWKNGAQFQGGPWIRSDATGNDGGNVVSPVLDVSEGDYFECIANAGSTRDVLSHDNTWFSIEEVGEYVPNQELRAEAIPYATTLTTGDGKHYFMIGAEFDGMNLTDCGIGVGLTKPVGSTIIVQFARLRPATPTSASRTAADMLSTRVTIDDGEWDSSSAAAAHVIDAANDDVAEGDVIRVDIDQVGSGTAGDGLFVWLQFQNP